MLKEECNYMNLISWLVFFYHHRYLLLLPLPSREKDGKRDFTHFIIRFLELTRSSGGGPLEVLLLVLFILYVHHRAV